MIIEEKKINKISESREKALNFFHKIGLPSRKLERWKYTDLSKKFADKVNVKDVDLLDANLFNKTQSLRDYVEANSCAARIDLNKINDLIQNVGIPGEDSIKLFFKNGNFIEELLDKRLLDNNIIIKKNDQIDNINNQLNYIGADDNKSPEPMLALNQALAFGGVSIEIRSGFKCDKLIELIYLDDNDFNNYRNYIKLNSGSYLRLAEVCLSKNNAINNIAMQVELDDSSDLDYLNYSEIIDLDNINDGDDSYDDSGDDLKNNKNFGNLVHYISVKQNKNSVFKSFNADFSCGLNRFDIDILLQEQNARCQLDGVYALSGKSHSDHHTRVRHIADNTISDQCYHGVLGDKSVGVFNGELIADKHTKNIDAHQLNKNLLLNKGAVIYTKPELRIETDDIKCGHGASIGELDDKSMFYLLSRGISKPQAKLMLMQAFLMRPVSDEDFSCWREFLDRLLSKSIRSHFWCEDNI